MASAPALTINFTTPSAEVFRSVDSLDDLRALAVEDFTGGENVLVDGEDSAGAGGLYRWAPSSLAGDSPPYVVRPDTVAALEAGRWIAVLNGLSFTTPQQWGAVADGVTDDFDAFEAARDSLNPWGGTLYIPAGAYYISDTLHFTSPIRLLGEGTGENPGSVAGVDYAAKEKYHGTRLFHPPGVQLLRFHTTTLESDITTVLAMTDLEREAYPSASRAVVRDLCIISDTTTYGSAPATYIEGADGIRSAVPITVDNVWIVSPAGCGVVISAASQTDIPADYGNANQTKLSGVKVLKAGDAGFYFAGRDANVIHLDNCDASFCGGWGYENKGFLGAHYNDCHSQLNNQSLRATFGGVTLSAAYGSFVTHNQNAADTFVGCYIEGPGNGSKAKLNLLSLMMGGIGANDTNHDADTLGLVMNGTGVVAGLFGCWNRTGTVNVRVGFGRGPSARTQQALWFGSADVSSNADGYGLDYVQNSRWRLRYGGSQDILDFVSSLNTSRTALANGYCLGAPNGVALGSASSAPRLLPSATAPTSSGVYLRGDIVPRSDMTAAGKAFKVCTTAGTYGSTAVFKDAGSIDA